jgi:hypothetical protein
LAIAACAVVAFLSLGPKVVCDIDECAHPDDTNRQLALALVALAVSVASLFLRRSRLRWVAALGVTLAALIAIVFR